MLIADGLANIVIGGVTNRRAALPIVAEASGPIAGFRAYMINNSPGYSAGTAGIINLVLCLCESNVPGDVIDIGEIVADPEFPNPSSGKGDFTLWRWLSNACLAEGHTYFVAFQNVDPAPDKNFQSLDLLIGPANQIGAPGVLWSDNGGPWELAAVGAPPVPGVFTLSPHLLTRVSGTSQGRAGCEVVDGKIIGAFEYGWPAGMQL